VTEDLLFFLGAADRQQAKEQAETTEKTRHRVTANVNDWALS
jgi:hypothetical protein